MQYNTQQKRMPLPEYGRSIQNMVDYALTIQDRAERQRCANTIINIMGNMFPHLRDVPDFKHEQRYRRRSQNCGRPLRTFRRQTTTDRRHHPTDGRTPEPELPPKGELQ